MSTGSWGMKNNASKQGVSQVLNRLTFMSTLSHTRRISTPIDNSGKLIPPRKLHNTQWGFICLAESDFHQGEIFNLASTKQISIGDLAKN